jgi:hypothetical protein
MIGTFPEDGTVLSELLRRGHTVVVASSEYPPVLSTAAYLYDLEYSDLRTVGDYQDLRSLADEYACARHDVIIVSDNPFDDTRNPADFFENWDNDEGLAPVTTGRNVPDPNQNPPATDSPLRALYDELVRPKGWRSSRLDSLGKEMCVSAHLGTAAKVRAAYWVLTSSPAVPNRRFFQETILRGVTVLTFPRTDFYHFDPDRHVFHFDPRILMRREYRADKELRRLYLGALSSLFPPHTCPVAGIPTARAVFEYSSRSDLPIQAGAVMGIVKNWKRNASGGHVSGGRVCLSYLKFAGELMAAQVATIEASCVVPAPATPYSRSQPGQVSGRLGEEVGRVLGKPTRPLLVKQGSQIVHRGSGKHKVILVDDQITTGDTLRVCANALQSEGSTVVAAQSYSAGGKGNRALQVRAPESQGFPLSLGSGTRRVG